MSPDFGKRFVEHIEHLLLQNLPLDFGEVNGVRFWIVNLIACSCGEDHDICYPDPMEGGEFQCWNCGRYVNA